MLWLQLSSMIMWQRQKKITEIWQHFCCFLIFLFCIQDADNSEYSGKDNFN